MSAEAAPLLLEGTTVVLLDGADIGESEAAGAAVVPAAFGLPPEAYDMVRRQFDAAAAVAAIAGRAPARPAIFVTGADLFIPSRAFVFGASVPAFEAAAASTFRLGRVRGRLRSVLLHEAAHLRGLSDCASACLLRPAATVADLDRRPEALCPACRARLAGSGCAR